MKKSGLKSAVLIILSIVLFPSFMYGQNSDFPQFEKTIEFDESKYSGELSADEMVEYAIGFSGYNAGSQEAEFVRNGFKQLKNEISSERFSLGNEKDCGNEILRLIYETTLRKYSESQNDIFITLHNGTYNCVTSNLIYIVCCKYAGLTVHAQKTPNHTFSTLVCGNEKIDVETTNPYGFDPGKKHDVSSKKDMSRYAYVPPKNYATRSTVSDRIMVSMIAGNRATASMNRNKYKAAVPLIYTRWLFVKDEDSIASQEVRHEFDVVCTNYAKVLQEQNKNSLCLEWIDYCHEQGMADRYMMDNFNDIVYNIIVHNINNNNLPASKKILSEKKKYLNEKTFLLLENAIKESGWINILNETGMSGNFEKGLELIEQAQKECPSSRILPQMKKSLQKNYGIKIHNMYADFFNSADYQNAKKIVENGLEKVPDNGLLKNDLKEVILIMDTAKTQVDAM